MNFEQLLSFLGEQWNDAIIYSVENREMTSHETDIRFFMTSEEAIQDAEKQWYCLPDQEARDYHEICVHRGGIEQSGEKYRFYVLQKIMKAYKKIYVTKDYADAWKTAKANQLIMNGLSDEDALEKAKNEFASRFAVQPVVRFGMFANYDYGPKPNSILYE